MPALKPETVIPTPEEDARITAAALADPDAPPLTDKEWEIARPFARIGRKPYAEPKKAHITLRLDVDVLAALKATGKGWQTRVNDAMREWVKTHLAA
ncbi:MAG: BrnA antitoxin family protein [Zoogloeaceae bacterium]|jgi:uncharacterized protein (DUF4415 family)|nr:BrnA antitoxin family protein [Zoogloeaceae bacterium]